VIWGVSTFGAGIAGHSNSSYGVLGYSDSSDGVRGDSYSGVGVYGGSSTSTGVYAFSGQETALIAEGVTGGIRAVGASSGVIGSSPDGHGVHGSTTTGYAGYFDGKVFTNKFHDIREITTPKAPGTNHARLFVRDSGGKTQLCVRFNTGTVKVLATQD